MYGRGRPVSSSSPDESQASAKPGPAAKIMIVDDEEDVLRSTELELQSLGYETIALSDPGQVIEIAERERPGLILQDLKMKGLNVAGLVASLRSNPATAEIPLVFFSASPDVDLMAAKYDAWGFLRKPFTEKELVQILEKALGGWPQERRLTARDPVQRDILSVFHDYWNLISALNSYTQTLLRSGSLGEAERRLVKGQEEVLMKLESRTDRLRSFLQSVVSQTPPTDWVGRPPAPAKPPPKGEASKERA